MLTLRILSVGVFWSAVLVSSHASAFVAATGGRGERPTDPIAALAVAGRWDNNEGDLMSTGQRGLGGGLEIAISPDYCTKLDFPEKPSCDEIKLAIIEGAARLVIDHSQVRFSDVTGLVEPQVDEAGTARGAEIDFFVLDDAASKGSFPENVAFVNTLTFFDYTPLLTNGQRGGTAIASADVFFAHEGKCYWLYDAALDENCINFGSMVMHEMTHAVGVLHPAQYAEWNVDTDDDPMNEMPIDCHDPMKGLRHSAQVDHDAVADHWSVENRNWFSGLRNDDKAVLSFLYPKCPDAQQPIEAPPVAAVPEQPQETGPVDAVHDGSAEPAP